MLTYKTNGNSVTVSIIKKLQGTQNVVDKALRVIALDLKSENENRVFGENPGGEAVDGSLIGSAQYSTKSTYISLDESPKKFTPKGKSGKAKFKDGRSHKSGYFPGGYKDFRNTIGRRIDRVNLNLSGFLSTQLFVQADGKSKYKVGFSSGKASKVADGLEEKYNQHIWGLSKVGREQSLATITRMINESLKK